MKKILGVFIFFLGLDSVYALSIHCRISHTEERFELDTAFNEVKTIEEVNGRTRVSLLFGEQTLCASYFDPSATNVELSINNLSNEGSHHFKIHGTRSTANGASQKLPSAKATLLVDKLTGNGVFSYRFLNSLASKTIYLSDCSALD